MSPKHQIPPTPLNLLFHTIYSYFCCVSKFSFHIDGSGTVINITEDFIHSFPAHRVFSGATIADPGIKNSHTAASFIRHFHFLIVVQCTPINAEANPNIPPFGANSPNDTQISELSNVRSGLTRKRRGLRKGRGGGEERGGEGRGGGREGGREGKIIDQHCACPQSIKSPLL